MQKNLNNISLQFARRVTRSRETNLTWAGIVFVGAFTWELAVSTLSSYLYTEKTGQDFKKEWVMQRQARFPAELLVPLSFGVLFLLFALVEVSAFKEDAKRFAELVLERYMKNAHFDTSNVKEKYLRDAAELLVANMPQSMRNEIVEIGTELNHQLDSRSFVKNKKARTILFKTAIDEISAKIDSLLAGNPELEQSMLYILQGIKPMQQPVQVKEK